ncbi:MAG: OmpP1/FadL family transporter [Brevirhabdus sp.]
MKRFLIAGAAALCATSATAGGIDRSGQGIGIIFEEGRYAELSFGKVTPSVDGNDVAIFGGGASGDVAKAYTSVGLAYHHDFTDKVSFSLIVDQPFGADVSYAASSVALGGTFAEANSLATTGILRYKINDRFSVHGGVRFQRADAKVGLTGAAYGALSGYQVTLGQDWATGFVLGAAYEIPDINLRVALTWNSSIKHTFDTVETLGGGLIGITPTTVKTPQSFNLDFQTGISRKHQLALIGSIRWVEWSKFKLDPATFTGLAGGGLISLDDSTTYVVGLAKRFNENWSAAVTYRYEKAGNPLVSPLAPTNGQNGITLAGIYTKDNMKVTAGINYTKLGDAQPETGTPDTARASFTGNDSLGFGIKVGFSF